MIKVNCATIDVGHFPDGSQKILYFTQYVNGNNHIYWQYENDEECMTLYYIVRHIRNLYPDACITLCMPYVANARMDRTKSDNEVFTLKWFCEFINSLRFNRVIVLDPHSNVATALLDRVVLKDLNDILERVINNELFSWRINPNKLIYFPDAGAMKRYSSLDVFSNYFVKKIYGEKNRDWETGKILGLKIMDENGDRIDGNDENKCLEGASVFMIDDIISYGGTMYYSALKLKELGAKDIYAYSSHTENSVLDEEKGTFIKALNDGTVNMLFTTNSIFSSNHDKISVFAI